MEALDAFFLVAEGIMGRAMDILMAESPIDLILKFALLFTIGMLGAYLVRTWQKRER